MLLGLAAAALAAEVGPPTAEEWARLREGEVVVRADTSGAATLSTAYVLVDATSQRLWPTILDLQARIPENSTLTGIREYRRVSPYEFYVAVEMSVVGVDVNFTNHWICAQDTCRYTLDPSQPNDMTLCDGLFRVEAAEGRSLLTYYSANEHRVRVPGWLRRWLAIDAVTNLLEKLKARAER